MKKIDIKKAKEIVKDSSRYIDMVLKMNIISLWNLLKNTVNYIKKRLKNYVFWLSISSFIYVLLEHFGFTSITPESYENTINTILGMLVVWGIIHNTTSKEKDKTIVESDGEMLSISSVPAPKRIKGKKAWKNRFKNYGLWIAIASLVALFAPKILGIPFDLGEWKTFVDAILSILVIFGVLNNPTTNNYGYGDDQA
jgi:uncharacterized membrane protein